MFDKFFKIALVVLVTVALVMFFILSRYRYSGTGHSLVKTDRITGDSYGYHAKHSLP